MNEGGSDGVFTPVAAGVNVTFLTYCLRSPTVSNVVKSEVDILKSARSRSVASRESVSSESMPMSARSVVSAISPLSTPVSEHKQESTTVTMSSMGVEAGKTSGLGATKDVSDCAREAGAYCPVGLFVCFPGFDCMTISRIFFFMARNLTP